MLPQYMSDLASMALKDTGQRRALRIGTAPGLRTRLLQLTEAQILLPALTILLLGLIWAGTINLIKIERSNATVASAAAVRDLVNTYEAQVIRAVREIDQTLKVVKYSSEDKNAGAVLTELKTRGLLPPDLLFVVGVVDRDGKVVASTRPIQAFSAPPELRRGLLGDALWVDLPRKDVASDEWTLQFGRALSSSDGTAAGAVVIEVDAAYFVSGYDPSVLGKKGLLALLGTDGIFRVRRTGENVTAGDRADYPGIVSRADREDPTVSLAVNSWDGERRFIAANQLYGFPLVVIAGLSMLFAPLNVAAFMHIPRELRGAAVGLLALLRNEGGSVGTSVAQTIQERREQFHLLRLNEYLGVLNPAVNSFNASAVPAFAQQTADPVAAKLMALQTLDDLRQQQASSLAYFDTFTVFGALSFVLVFLVFLMRRAAAEKGAHVAAD